MTKSSGNGPYAGGQQAFNPYAESGNGPYAGCQQSNNWRGSEQWQQYNVVHQRNVPSADDLSLGWRARSVERERCAQIAECGGSSDEIAKNIRSGERADEITKA